MARNTSTGPRITRRDLLRTASGAAAFVGAATALGGLRSARAAAGPIVISDFGGEWADWNRQVFDSVFTEKTGVEVNRDTGADNAARIAKIKLGLSDSTYDIGVFADAFFARAETEGLLKGMNYESPRLTHLPDIDKRFVRPNYVSHFYNGLGLAYNPSMVVATPTAWADMWNPAYKGKIVLPTVNHSFGLHVVLICALAAGKDYTDVDAALVKLEELAALDPIWALDSQAIMRSHSQGEAAIGWLGRGEHYQILKAGGDTKFILPKEGGFFTSWACAPITNTRYIEAVEDYIDVCLDPELLAKYATHWGFHPTNNKWVEFADEETIERISFKPGEDNFVDIDYAWLSANRSSMTEQWNRVVGA